MPKKTEPHRPVGGWVVYDRKLYDGCFLPFLEYEDILDKIPACFMPGSSYIIQFLAQSEMRMKHGNCGTFGLQPWWY